MANTDDTAKKQDVTQLERFLDVQRRKLLQAHSVMHCLYEVLLYADGEDAVRYAEAAHLAAMLVDDVIEQLDPARLRPMIESLERTAKASNGNGSGGDQVREPCVVYIN